MSSSISLFIIILVGRQDERRAKEVKRMSVQVLQYLERKAMMPAQVIMASKMSQHPGIMTREVEQHRI